MCKITVLVHTCKHGMDHTWSSCRGLKKKGPGSSRPACRKTPIFYVYASHKCGTCYRADAEEEIYRELGLTRDQGLTETQQAILDERLTEVTRNIPTTNWRVPPPPVYGRRPSQSRPVTRRRKSLLSQEVKAEDVAGPEAWESVSASEGFTPVYQTVCSGWDIVSTQETKSLVEELARDAAERGVDVESNHDEEEQDETDYDAGEEDEEADDFSLLAQQTPLPLDPEVDDGCDDYYSAFETSLPTMVIDVPMPVEDEIASAKTTLETSPGTQHLPVFMNNPQSAESRIEGNKTQPSRPTKPYGPSHQLAGDSKVRYWYRKHTNASSEHKNELGCWELVSAALI